MTANSDNDQQRQQDSPAEGKRPEEAIEEWGRRAGRLLASAAARVREEAEDMWAEAQSIRRGEQE